MSMTFKKPQEWGFSLLLWLWFRCCLRCAVLRFLANPGHGIATGKTNGRADAAGTRQIITTAGTAFLIGTIRRAITAVRRFWFTRPHALFGIWLIYSTALPGAAAAPGHRRILAHIPPAAISQLVRAILRTGRVTSTAATAVGAALRASRHGRRSVARTGTVTAVSAAFKVRNVII